MLPPAPQFATTSMIQVLAGRAARARSGEAGWQGYIVAEGLGLAARLYLSHHSGRQVVLAAKWRKSLEKSSRMLLMRIHRST